ncbi:MAG: metallophosphoesterase family protein [Eubacteriales bacterium]|nr:metallophosphoesterase family protein [Eubacteriales bacterium]
MLLGILADVHEDIIRLKESIEIFKTRNVDEIICLGDVVGFCVPYYSYLETRDSNKVVEWIKDNCSVSVIGNHDLYAIRKIPKNNKCFKYKENWYDLDYDTRKETGEGKVWLYEKNELSSLLNDANREYIRNLPEYLIRDYENYKILYSHYFYPDVTGCLSMMISDISELQQHFEFMKQNNCLYTFSGNDHYQGIKVFTEESIIEIKLGEKYILPEKHLWLHVPAVANGTQQNGIAIFNTETREIEAIPLNTPPHKYK